MSNWIITEPVLCASGKSLDDIPDDVLNALIEQMITGVWAMPAAPVTTYVGQKKKPKGKPKPGK